MIELVFALYYFIGHLVSATLPPVRARRPWPSVLLVISSHDGVNMVYCICILFIVRLCYVRLDEVVRSSFQPTGSLKCTSSQKIKPESQKA